MTRMGYVNAGVLLVAACLVPIAADAQVAEFIDFDDLAVGTPVYTQYAGVTFVDGDSSPPIVQVVQPSQGTVSGTKALQSDESGEFVGSQLSMIFDSPQRHVKLSVGLADSSRDRDNLLVVLRGYTVRNPTEAQLAAPATESPIVFLGSPPRRVDTPLEIWSPGAEIVMARVTILSPNWEDVAHPSPDNIAVAIDNLEFSRPASPPPPDTAAPFIAVSYPSEGEIIEGAVAGTLEMYMRGNVIDKGLRSLLLSVNGRAPQPLSFQARQDGAYPFLRTVFGGDGLSDGPNELVVTAVDFDDNEASLTRRFIYVVKPVPPPSIVDLVPVAVEVNQAVSARPFELTRSEPDGYSIDFPQWVKLIENTPTVVRVYAVAEQTPQPVPGVPARMIVRKKDCGSDCRLGELLPNGSPTTVAPGITVQPAGSAAATLNALSQNIGATWNFLIPGAWTTQDLELLVDINRGDQPVAECEAQLAGECERDNRVTIRLSFQPQKVVSVHPILVRELGTLNGLPVDRMPDSNDIATMLEGLNTLYPARFDLGPTRSITVDPNISGGALLDKIQERFGCVAPSLSPSTWWACGYDPTRFNVALTRRGGGLANLGNNTVWANTNRITPAHEVGHAIGFMHATCDHGEASGGGCDDFYPFSHGRIARIGFDITNWRLLTYTLAPNAPHPHDFMSYGPNRWVSRYMWNVTADHATVDSVSYDWCMEGFNSWYRCGLRQGDVGTATAPDGPVYLVHGQVDAAGNVELYDAYLLPSGGMTPPDDTPSDYRLELVDEKGNTLSTRAVNPRLRVDGEGDVLSSSFLAELEAPATGSPARINLLDGGGVVTTLVARARSAPVVFLNPLGGPPTWARGEERRVRWLLLDPAVRATARVEYVPGGDEAGLVLGTQIEEGFLDISVDDLPASDNARIVVRVSDGIHTSSVTSQPFVVEPAPPTALIIKPAEAITVPEGFAVALFGLGADDRASLPDRALSWSSDLSGSLGSGSRAVASDLAPGVHTITLRATAGNGLSATDTVTVTVASVAFLRGDCNDDGMVNVADAACSLGYLFAGAAEPDCLASLNTNGDSDVDVVDPIALLNFLFGDGSAPVAPFPDCGTSELETDSALGCTTSCQ